MEVHLPQYQQSQLSTLAAETGRGIDDIVEEAVARMLAYDEWFRAQVQIGIDQIARGEFIEEAEMDERVERMLRPLNRTRWSPEAAKRSEDHSRLPQRTSSVIYAVNSQGALRRWPIVEANAAPWAIRARTRHPRTRSYTTSRTSSSMALSRTSFTSIECSTPRTTAN